LKFNYNPGKKHIGIYFIYAAGYKIPKIPDINGKVNVN